MKKEDFFALRGITEADFHPVSAPAHAPAPAPASTNDSAELEDIKEALNILLGGDTE